MRATVRLARDAGAAVGAHPGFPDLVGFGRRELRASPRDVEDMVVYQIGALAAIAHAEGVALAHVKAHGALYNMAVRDRRLADAVAAAVASFDKSLIFFGLAGSGMLDAGRAAGLDVAAEGFADRSYEHDGTLTPRSVPGAVIKDVGEVVDRAVLMARDGRVRTRTGTEIPLRIDTICVHGDTPGAAILAAALRQGLERAGIQVSPMRTQR